MSTLAEVAYIQILGFPVIFWLGIITYVLVLTAFSLMHFGRRRPWKFRWHRYLGWTVLAVATFHGLLALSAYL